nr:DUF6531 domain-containing protein [Methylocystis iwaonis]
MCSLIGDPINYATGSFYQQESDYEGGGAYPLALKRYHNSSDTDDIRNFGRNWRGSYSRSITSVTTTEAQATRDDGRVLNFVLTGGVWKPDGDVNSRLNKTASGWTYITALDETETYDSFGRLVSIANRAGLTRTFTYDASGRLSSARDHFGRSIVFSYSAGKSYVASATVPGGVYTYGYDVNDRLISVTYPGGAQRRYVYENASYPNNLTGVIDENGARYLTVAYDANGRAISSEHAGGADKNAVNYGSLWKGDNTVRITKPLGAIETYSMLATFGSAKNGSMTRTCSNCGTSAGGVEAYSYDANGNVAGYTDFKGDNSTYSYDLARNLETSRTLASGTAQAQTTTTTWHASYRLPLRRAEPGRTFDYVYDAKGNLLSKTITAGTLVRTYSYTYSAVGQVLTATDPLGNVTTYTYDATGNLATVKNPLAQVTSYTNYDVAGRLTRVVDPNGVVTLLSYDTRGRLTQVSVDASGTTPANTTIQYDAAAQITKITQPNGAFESFAYDAAHRLLKTTNAAGETINYARNANGDVTSVTIKRADGVTAYARSQTFDQLARVVSAIGAGSQSYQFAYDNNDNLIKVTDPRANVFSYGFDPLNRLITETDEEAKTVTLTRNGIDAITAYQDARGLATNYVRNGFGEVIQEASPDKGTTGYARDARGLVATRTDARGMTTTYAYDKIGRLANKDYTDGTYWQSFAWDASAPDNKGIGRLSGVYSEAGASWRVFDGKGRVTADYRTNNPAPALATQYTHDASGNVLHMVYPSGRVINYARDAAGRISGVTTQKSLGAADQTIVYNVTWNPYGPLAQMTFGYGAVAKFATDTDYRVTRYQLGSATDPSAIIDRSLAWTGDIVTSIIDNKNPGTTPGQYGSQSQSFTYTPTRRLSSATGYYGTLAWSYDANGNRTTETANGVVSTYAYPATSNRLTSVAPSGQTARSFAYDAAGDILTDSRTGALGMTFQYDVEGRLSKAWQTNAPAQGGTYAYDAFNRLASRTVNGTTTLYVHDINDHVIAETNAAGQTLREYIWLNDIPVAVVDGVNTATPAIYYVHTDHLGRPARMVAQNWAWAWDVIYTPFGGVSAIWDSTAKLDMRFPGQWFQLENGLAYNWHRHYDATIGRYVQPDPLRVGSEGERILGGQSLASDKMQTILDLPEPILSGAATLGERDGFPFNQISRANYPNGPSIYSYVNHSPLSYTDREGLQAFTPDQSALIGLCKSAKRAGVTEAEAGILLGWALFYGIPFRDDRSATHWVGGPHIHVGPVNHIPVK